MISHGKSASSIFRWTIVLCTEFIPQDLCQTKKKVDAFVISQSRKICLVGPELTVPIEERIAFWNEKKTGKYEKMIADDGSPSAS